MGMSGEEDDNLCTAIGRFRCRPRYQEKQNGAKRPITTPETRPPMPVPIAVKDVTDFLGELKWRK